MPTVAELIGAALVRAGARTAFTSGGAGSRRADGAERSAARPLARLVDAMAQRGPARLIEAMAQHGPRAVQVERGAAACEMASVAGRLTDAPGLAVLALDEQDDEIAPALLQAQRDRAPLIAVTDRAIALDDAVKASLVVTADSAAHLSAHACQLALTEPRGPVHLVVTPDTAVASALPVATAVRPAPLAPPDPEILDGVAALLGGAQRPVLVVGGECRTLETAMWLRALAESLPAPVLVTPRGRGALPDP